MRCRGRKWGPVSKTWTLCDLKHGHSSAHFADCIETYLVWPRRGQKHVHIDMLYDAKTRKTSPYSIRSRCGQTCSAEPWVLWLVIQARNARLARATCRRSSPAARRSSLTLLGTLPSVGH